MLQFYYGVRDCGNLARRAFRTLPTVTGIHYPTRHGYPDDSEIIVACESPGIWTRPPDLLGQPPRGRMAPSS